MIKNIDTFFSLKDIPKPFLHNYDKDIHTQNINTSKKNIDNPNDSQGDDLIFFLLLLTMLDDNILMDNELLKFFFNP